MEIEGKNLSYYDYNTYINEEILKQRLEREENGSVPKQLLVTVAVCFGSFSFGNIISWGGPSLEYIKTLAAKEADQKTEYEWLVGAAPMAAAISIFLWSFLVNRIGAKTTLILQTPVLLITWVSKGYARNFEFYWTAHFFAGFCASSYIYAGLILLIQSTHSKYIKIFYSLFNSCIMLGFMSMNVFSKFLNPATLCTVCASMPVISLLLFILVPDSPVFLMMIGKTQKAEQALKFYAGKKSYIKEWNVIKQYVLLMKQAEQEQFEMFRKKVVFKAILIIMGLQIFRSMTGYYAFLLDSVRLFRKTDSYFNPYDDGIIFGGVAFLTNLIGTFTFLHGNFRLKIPLMFSIGLMSTILATLGFVVHFKVTKVYNWLLLFLICLFGTVYNFGMDVIPSIILYQYVPLQIYDIVMRLMTIFHWFMVFFLVRIYMWLQLKFGISSTYWILSVVSLIGLIFIGIFVIEAKGKSLTQIQLELGGNPVGNRGSKRQRIPNPFGRAESFYLRKLIADSI